MIEKPFRAIGKNDFSRWRPAIPIGSHVVIFVFSYVISNDKLITLIIPEKLAAASQMDKEYKATLNKICDNADTEPCHFGVKSKSPTVILWGDSHARHLVYGLDKKFKEEGVGALLISSAGCAPLIDVIVHNRTPFECRQSNNLALTYFENSPKFKTVILAARWDYYSSADGFRLTKGMDDASGTSGNDLSVFAQLASTIKKIEDLQKDIVLVTEVPIFPNYRAYFECRKSFILGLRGQNRKCRIDFSKQLETDNKLRAISDHYEAVDVINLKLALCIETACRATNKKTLYYADDNHLNLAGSEYVVRTSFRDIQTAASFSDVGAGSFIREMEPEQGGHGQAIEAID
ncbi:hypothetical protein GCM10007094_08600 [Pseudovibrio japonicus]|uniref:SGNH domain-containing protein n=2 Tax=Pseudovibrio japonicus TaxID=366534 RepID=A0ABQ3E1I5_9HYPH|nr:hypothetical protein GCM10007094_08600 [Pseudovibrio japonicus]